MKMDDLDLQIKYTPPSINFSCMNISKSTQIRSTLFLEKKYWTILKHLKSTSHRTHYTATLMCCEAQ